MYEIQQQTQSMLLKHWTKGIMFSTLYILVHLKMAYTSKHKLKRERLKPDLEQTFYFVSSI